MPVQTAYAVPSGNVRTAIDSIQTLAIRAATVSVVGTGRVNPSVYLRPTAHAVSRTPAAIRITQGMRALLYTDEVVGRPAAFVRPVPPEGLETPALLPSPPGIVAQVYDDRAAGGAVAV
jgi:hypothetical protein